MSRPLSHGPYVGATSYPDLLYQPFTLPIGPIDESSVIMQYVRSISGSVSKTWNSINPATLSGAIDVIVIEQEDGTYPLSHRAEGVELTTSRHTRLFAVPRPVRKILPPPSV